MELYGPLWTPMFSMDRNRNLISRHWHCDMFPCQDSHPCHTTVPAWSAFHGLPSLTHTQTHCTLVPFTGMCATLTQQYKFKTLPSPRLQRVGTPPVGGLALTRIDVFKGVRFKVAAVILGGILIVQERNTVWILHPPVHLCSKIWDT